MKKRMVVLGPMKWAVNYLIWDLLQVVMEKRLECLKLLILKCLIYQKEPLKNNILLSVYQKVRQQIFKSGKIKELKHISCLRVQLSLAFWDVRTVLRLVG